MERYIYLYIDLYISLYIERAGVERGEGKRMGGGEAKKKQREDDREGAREREDGEVPEW